MPKARAKTKHIEHKSESIELLLTKPINPDNNKGNPVIPVDRSSPEGFAEKFSLFLDETPNIGSTSDPEFFIHGILGSALMLPESGLMEKLGVDKVYIKHTKVEHVQGSRKVEGKVNVVKLCFSLEKDGKKQIALRVFTNDEITGDGNPEDKYLYSDDELKEIAEKLGISDIDNINVDEYVFRIHTEGDPGNKSFRLHKEQTGGVKEKFKAAASSQSQINNEFKEVSAQSTSLEDAFTKLSSKNVEEVIGGTEKIFEKFASTYQDNQKQFSLRSSEAALHGFAYGALALNFKYRYGLNCYVERIAGNGRTDLIFMSRTKDANGRMNPKPIPVVVEVKDGTVDEAIAQVKNKGYLYNLNVRTKAEKAAIVGIAKDGGLKVEKDDIFQSRGFIRQILENTQEFSQDNVDAIKGILKGELKNLYHSIQSHERYYLSRLVLGQVLAVNDYELDKYIFTYANQDESMEREATTFVLFNQNEGKAVILNIIEYSGEQRKLRGQEKSGSEKIPPIDELEIDSAVKIDVIINTGVQHKPDGFEIEGREDKSYYQNINIKKVSGSSQGKFQGQFKKIGNVEVGSLVKGLQESSDIGRTRGDKKRSDEKLGESLSPLAEALFPFKGLIKKEVDFQAIMQGLFMNGETEDNKEIRVYTESNASPQGRMDLALSFTQLSEKEGSLTEDDPIIMEFKLISKGDDANRKLKQAEKQMSGKYKALRSFTNKKTAKHLAMVFDNSAKNKNNIIKASMQVVKIDHTTSQGGTNSGSSPEKSSSRKRPFAEDSAPMEGKIPSSESSPPRKGQRLSAFGSPYGLAGCSSSQPQQKRSIEATCVDSHSEESIEKKERREKLIKKLSDTDEVRERIKNVEFCDQLYEISEQISKGKIIDKSAEEAFIVKVKDIDLNSIDPEIRDIVKEMRNNVENKEEIKNILKRSGVAEKIGKVAEGAGLAFTVFLVGKHIANGNIEGLGYDALNLWVMPKIGEKISGKILELGTKLDSQTLKGFAPVMGRAIGNFAAFLGLAESIKARQNATDPVDIKIADLNIATNSIFIAADVPAVITETTSAIGMEAGVISEFAGPVGAAVSAAVITILQFVEAELEVEKLAEQISLTDQEKHDLYWDFFFGKKVPDYIERDIEAKNIYKQYISKIIDKFDKDGYTKIIISLPSILITKEEYATNAYSRNKRQWEGIGQGMLIANSICRAKTKVVNNELDFGLETGIMYQFHNSGIDHYSRIIPNTIASYNLVCGPREALLHGNLCCGDL